MNLTENKENELKEDPDWINGPKHKFNFAAFIMPQFWGLGNGVYLGLLAFIPILYPFIAIYLGSKGTEIAYENSYGRPEQFFKKQRRWQYAAVVYLIAVITLVVGFMFGNEHHFTHKQYENKFVEEDTAKIDPVEETLEEPTESMEPESVEEEVKIYQPNEDGYYILRSEDSLISVALIMPDGFQMYEFSDEYSFECTDLDVENGLTNIFVWIEKKDAESEKTSMLQQVELTFALNNYSSTEIGEI